MKKFIEHVKSKKDIHIVGMTILLLISIIYSLLASFDALSGLSFFLGGITSYWVCEIILFKFYE